MKQHSNKTCWCGGHNSSNAKSKKSHNSTKKKLDIKKARKIKNKLLCLA